MLLRTVCAWTVIVCLAFCDEDQPDLDVPFEPTHPEVVEAMLKLAEVTAKDVLYDLGCGDGRIVVAAAQKRGARGIGYDIDPQRIKDSEENAKGAGVSDRVKFIRGDIMEADLSGATVVTLYLLNSVNVRLRPHLFRDLAPGTRVVSHAFTMAEWDADQEVTHPKARADTIYFWVIPAPAGGVWTWSEKTDKGETAYSLKLEQAFQMLTGSLTSPDLKRSRAAEGKLAGRDLKVTITGPGGKQWKQLVLEGKVNGDVLEGTQNWVGGANAGKRPFRAQRSPVTLVGDWQVKTRAKADKIDGVLKIKKTDEKLSFAYVKDVATKDDDTKDDDAKEIGASAYYVWGSSVRIEIPFDGDDPHIFTGFFDGASASGKVKQKSETREVSWTATRGGGAK